MFPNRYKQTRISSLTTILIAILHWIWPPDRCTNCHSIYSSPNLPDDCDIDGKRRFTQDGTKLSYDHTTNNNNIDVVDGPVFERRNSTVSQKSSSDDGGFLSRRNFITARASWRRPLVASSSQVSLQSAADSARGFLQGLGGLLKIGGAMKQQQQQHFDEAIITGARYQNVLRPSHNIYRNIQQNAATSGPLHINTLSGSLSGQQQLYTPSRNSRIFSSSPASTPGQQQLLSLSGIYQANHHHTHFSDLSTVYPNSTERSLPTSHISGTGNLSRYRNHSQELPSLRTIQEETRRQQPPLEDHFLPLQLPSPPSWRNYYQMHQQLPYHSYRPRTRWYPRHHSRLFSRQQHELLSPLPDLNLSLRGTSHGTGVGLEASPESRSSSSGFGSKNTSNHPGSASEWRLLPPYRAPPSPPKHSAYFGAASGNQQAQAQTLVSGQFQQNPCHYSYLQPSPTSAVLTSPYTMAHWLEMISRLNAATDNNLPKPNQVDVGSVDGHYEFDPATPTPSASTPTGVGLLRDDLNLHIDTLHYPQHQVHHYHHHAPTTLPFHHHHAHHTLGPLSGSLLHASASGSAASVSRKLRSLPRYDNVEARLQAMREEFYAYRKRQAMQRTGGPEIESVC